MAYNGSLLIIILHIDLKVWNIGDKKQTNTEHYWTIEWIWHYFRIMEQIWREMCSGGSMEMEQGCDRVLISSQRFKRWVNTILYITSFDRFSLDMPRELERMFHFSPSNFGGGYKIINLKSSNDFPLYPTEFSAYFFEEYAWVIFC